MQAKSPNWVNASTKKPSTYQESGKQPILDKSHTQLIEFAFVVLSANQRTAQPF
jgi:hypothetical protein